VRCPLRRDEGTALLLFRKQSMNGNIVRSSRTNGVMGSNLVIAKVQPGCSMQTTPTWRMQTLKPGARVARF
jgi:hypothetical protein